MAATVRGAVRELLESTQEMIDYLLSLPDDEVALPSSHVCAQGGELWHLLTNDIDHETIHAGQVLEARYESRITARPMERLVAEWLKARALFLASFVGMTEDQFNQETAPGGWTYRAVAKHILELERHSIETVKKDIREREG
jgi:uncharacterized damage-inducible protein DinB